MQAQEESRFFGLTSASRGRQKHQSHRSFGWLARRYAHGEPLLAIADAVAFPPALLARFAVDRLLGGTKQAISTALKDPDTIPGDTITAEVG